MSVLILLSCRLMVGHNGDSETGLPVDHDLGLSQQWATAGVSWLVMLGHLAFQVLALWKSVATHGSYGANIECREVCA